MSNHPQKSGSLCSGMSGSLCSGIGGSLYSGIGGSLYPGIGGSLYPGILILVIAVILGSHFFDHTFSRKIIVKISSGSWSFLFFLLKPIKKFHQK